MLADEAVFDAEEIIGERLVVEDVSEATAEAAFVLVVGNLEQAVFDAEGVAVVVVQLVAFDFDGPTVEVLAVEELDPVAGSYGLCGDEYECAGEDRVECLFGIHEFARS